MEHINCDLIGQFLHPKPVSATVGICCCSNFSLIIYLEKLQYNNLEVHNFTSIIGVLF